MKFKRLMNAVIAVAMVGINIFNGILPVLAAGEEDPTIQNPDPVTLDDGVVLSKTVKSVEGYANKWEVTLRIESPKVEKTSDTVIVIDRSGSMGGNSGRLTAAKSAARSLAQQLLPSGNTTNRVAVVSFASSATSGTDFTTNYDTVSSVIGQMSARGGTFTQSAIRMAADLLKNSTADIKTMILLSDGEPTYSYPFTRDARADDDNFVAYGQALETSPEVDQSVFSYSASGSVGDGSNLRQCMEYDGWNCVKYYNNGNSAIAEAGYFKDSGNGDLYTIALEAGDVGTPILNAIASPGKHYTATPSELTTIFNQIGGNILSLVQNASVEDTMGHGVKVSGADGTTIEWDPVVFTLQGNVFVAEKSYIVEMDENVYDQTSADGFYALNESAVLTYNDGKTGEFPIPKAKPFDLDVEKELYVDGSKKDNEEFKFKVSGNGDEEVYTIKSGSHHKIPIPMPIKLGEEYTVTEVGVGSSNEIPFEYYDEPEYTVIYNGEEQAGSNKFIVTKNHGDEINVKIKNNYESAAVSASKVWDDNSDQDGLRKNYNDLWVVVKDEGSGKYVGMKKLAAVDQSYSFSGLHKNRNGSPISYKVVEASGCEEGNNGTITCEEVYDGNNGEVSIDDDYTVEVGENNVITNAHTPATVKITVNKDWDDDNNRDGLRTNDKPVEFCVTGKVNGETVYEKTCKTASSLLDEIEIEFTGLPKYDNGEEIEYMVEESEFLGYNATGLPEEAFTVEDEEDVDVTNVHTPEKISILIQKVWDDSDNNDGKRPDQISATLTGGDEDVPVTIKESDSVEGKCEEWCVEVTDLYKNKQGSAIEYNVTEDDLGVDGYTLESIEGDAENGFTITNTYEPETVTVSVDKSWNDDNNRDGLRTDSSTVTFCVTGYAGEYTTEPECKTVLTGVGLKTDLVTFTGLLKYHNGDELNYEVTEVDVLDGYTSDLVAGEYVVITDNEGTQEVTNTYTPEKISILIQKVWDDSDNNDGKRPDQISATLTGGDEDVPVTIKESDSVEGKCEEWCVEVTDLYKNKQGSAIEYSVTENDLGVDGYTLKSIEGDAENGFTITNTYEPETVTVSVDKSWNDDNNRDGLRTDSSTVTFCVTGYAGDYTTEPVCKTVLTGVGLKTDLVTFTGLLKYHNGDELNYEVTEVDVLDGYTSDLVAGEYVVITDNEGTQEVTNTYTPEKISILIQKVWDDEDDEDEIRPDEITVVISGDDEDVTLTINADSAVEGKCEEWCAEATDLHKNKDGEEIEYSVTENEVAGYEAEIEGDAENGFVITNSHTPEPEPEPEDPCEKGGCGGTDTTPVSAPETGQLMKSENGSIAETAWINNAIGGATMVLLGISLFAVSRRKN